MEDKHEPDSESIVTEINRLARAIVSATHSPVADDVVTAIQALGAQLAAAAATVPHQEPSEPGPDRLVA